LHGRVEAVELGASVIEHALRATSNVEVVAGHGDLLWASMNAT
jgi:hypothetical protein